MHFGRHRTAPTFPRYVLYHDTWAAMYARNTYHACNSYDGRSPYALPDNNNNNKDDDNNTITTIVTTITITTIPALAKLDTCGIGHQRAGEDGQNGRRREGIPKLTVSSAGVGRYVLDAEHGIASRSTLLTQGQPVSGDQAKPTPFPRIRGRGYSPL